MAAPILSSPSETCWDYDVFLSFRGEDTRKNFTDHLYRALDQAGVRTFRDNEELPRGKIISTELPEAIRGSKICIVIFSKDYASSTWCLDELADIMECCRENRCQTFLPIFYHVDPSDVRKQTGTFEEAFVRHEERYQTNMAKVERWREALIKAGSFSGWDLPSVEDGYEGKFIDKILDQVLCKLNPLDFEVAEHPVGINSRVEEVKALLNLKRSDFRILGIYGIGGIGKTTIAKAVYNQIHSKFERSSYLLDIKEISKKVDGLVQLQKQLLFDILKKEMRIDHSDRGIELIKNKLNKKRILVVLDDVDDLDQLQKLLGGLKWFCMGSRVIITTRNGHLLTALDVLEKYKVSPLVESESLKLFSWYAFEMTHPRQGFEEYSLNAVKYVEGIPLALKVLGSFLKGRKYTEWKSELEKLQRKPNNKIQKVLRTSFDSLEDSYIQDIFLDIACFFVGMEKCYIMKILEGCGLFPDSGMTILEQRSLLIIHNNKLGMHNLIQDMGREIVREKANYVVTNYSRLWFHEDVLDVLSKHTASQHVKGININSLMSEDVHLETKAFANMKELRLLRINAIHLRGNFNYLSNELRWLCWKKCPLKFLPHNFCLEKLVILDLQQSKIVQVWKDHKILNKLKVLNLKDSKDLIKSPDFSRVPHLEILTLNGCTRLVQVHESIGYLTSLVELNLKGCISLTSLPRSIGNLKSLRILDMSNCFRLFQSLEQVRNMDLIELHGNETTIDQKLSFLSLSKNHRFGLFGGKQKFSDSQLSCLSYWISPKGSFGISLPLASISIFCHLEMLSLEYCGLCDDNFHMDLENLSSLLLLSLSGNEFRNIPLSIKRLPRLLRLNMDNCMALQSISELPTSLWSLSIWKDPTLSRVSNLMDTKHLPFFVFGCESDNNQVNLLRHISLPFICTNIPDNSFQGQSRKGIQFPIIFLQNTEVPNWFSHQAVGSLVSFRVPPFSKVLTAEILVCACYGQMPYAPNCTSSDGPVVAISIYNRTKDSNLSLHTEVPLHFAAAPCHIYRIPVGYDMIDDILRSYYTRGCRCFSLDSQRIYFHDIDDAREIEFETGDEMEVSVEFGGGFEVRKCGIQLQPRSFSPLVTISEDDVATVKWPLRKERGRGRKRERERASE